MLVLLVSIWVLSQIVLYVLCNFVEKVSDSIHSSLYIPDEQNSFIFLYNTGMDKTLAKHLVEMLSQESLWCLIFHL